MEAKGVPDHRISMGCVIFQLRKYQAVESNVTLLKDNPPKYHTMKSIKKYKDNHDIKQLGTGLL